MIDIVSEQSAHIRAREALLDAAFGPQRFAKTCERLREGRLPAAGLAFGALDGDRLVGTIRLWSIAAGPGRPALLLGPLAVQADCRSAGLGGRMVRHALDAARRAGHGAVLLVGDAPYYERFGFMAAATGELRLPGPYEHERFLGLELVPGALAGAAGPVGPTGIVLPQVAMSLAA